MTDRLDEAVAKVRALPADTQEEAAEILLDFIAEDTERYRLTPEQRDEIRRRMALPPKYATDEEVLTTFERLLR